MVSAMSSGVKGSQPLLKISIRTICSQNLEFGFNLTGVDSDNSDALGDQLLAQTFGERVDGSLGGTVNASANIRLAACDGANVDDVARSLAVVALEHTGENGLCDIDQTSDIGSKHDVDVVFLDLWRLVDTLNKTAAHTSLAKTASKELAHKRAHLFRLAHIKLNRVHLDAITDLLDNILGNLTKVINSARRQNQLEVLGAGAGEFKSRGLSDAGRCTSDEHCLAFKAL
ncbi:hypothetical protein HG530_014938 [Fusarium avenaceum]|nr:hypothetical protein HG530_014938 [Fusarium avenaceum]